MTAHSNSVSASALYLASSTAAPLASSKPRLTRDDLKLYVNGEYRAPMRNRGLSSTQAFGNSVGFGNSSNAARRPASSAAEKLAQCIHYEFVHLGSDMDTSMGALVTLKFIPLDTDMHEACKILAGLGYKATAHYSDPKTSREDPVVTVWVEYEEKPWR